MAFRASMSNGMTWTKRMMNPGIDLLFVDVVVDVTLNQGIKKSTSTLKGVS
jgi:hypothetical protein